MKILIIQIRQLGDVLLSATLAEAIKDNNKKHTVHFLTSEASKDILTGNPYIDKTLLLKKGLISEIEMIHKIRKEQYDAVIDIQRTGRSKRLTLFSSAIKKVAFRKKSENFYYNTLVDHARAEYTVYDRLDLLKGIGIQPEYKYMPRLFFRSEDIHRIKKYLNEKSIEEFFVVSPTARKKEKMWPPEQFGKLADKIYKKTNIMPVIVYGSEIEKQMAKQCARHIERCSVIEKPFSIKEFAALLSLSAFFIGNDSFPAHVAVSQNTKAFVVCGPTSGWFLNNDKTMSIYKGLDCQPCNDYKSCKFNMMCYKSLKYDEVFLRISDFLLSPSPFPPIIRP